MDVLPARMPVYHMSAVLQGHRKVPDLPEVDLQMFVNCRVGPENRTWVPWRNSQCSQQMSLRSGPSFDFLRWVLLSFPGWTRTFRSPTSAS